jgi:5,10-methylenetetrahydromethanopterin reductase
VTLELSCAFATSLATPDHVAVAESLGYRRAWLYDSPALYPDVWMTLALAAQRTRTITLGPGVLVPNLRHPMTTASAIGTLCALAPGRVEIAVGSGFTGRLTLGQKPLPWSFVRAWVAAVQGLLAGETVEWEGGAMRMLHPDGFAPARPIVVPFILGTGGPKGNAVARELAEGIFATSAVAGFDRCAVLTFGTVLDDGEDPAGERVVAAAGHAAGLAYHGMHLRAPELVRTLPGGEAWLADLESFPAEQRHLALHDGHLVEANERDLRAIRAGGPDAAASVMRRFGGARTRTEWAEHLDALAASGATEVAYQPAGPDIPGELERFAEAARAAGQIA